MIEMGMDLEFNYISSEELKHTPILENLPDFCENQWYSFQDGEYWRKFYGLYNWMENLYKQKGGTTEFNNILLKLTSDDLIQLEKDCENIEFYNDYYMGKNPTEEMKIRKPELLSAIARAKIALDSGCVVYFQADY